MDAALQLSFNIVLILALAVTVVGDLVVRDERYFKISEVTDVVIALIIIMVFFVEMFLIIGVVFPKVVSVVIDVDLDIYLPLVFDVVISVDVSIITAVVVAKVVSMVISLIVVVTSVEISSITAVAATIGVFTVTSMLIAIVFPMIIDVDLVVAAAVAVFIILFTNVVLFALFLVVPVFAGRAPGSFIKSRFTQRDIDQQSVVYLLPVDIDVTRDNFLFVLSDPAGNSLPPQSLDLSWSRVDFSASCFRTCETSGTLQIQVQRSGSSADPAFVSIQVQEGSARVGRDFTHSSAALLQFDPGVKVKTWSVFPIDDGLEENHESFTLVLKNPHNCVLGARTSATVEIIDPRAGRCDPDSFEDFAPVVPPGRAPDPGLSPGPVPVPDPDPVTDIETDLIFEPDPQTPRRGDVPNRELDFSLRDQAWTPDQAWTQDQVQSPHRLDSDPREAVRTERRRQERVWTFHGLTPLRAEPLEQPLRDAPGPPPEGATSAPQTQGVVCPVSWRLHRGRCFLRSLVVASWSSAVRTCSERLNSSLASVQVRRDLSFLWRLSNKTPFWTDLSEGADSEVLALSGHKGALSSPQCVLIQNPKTWTQTNCSSETEHTFICSKPGLNQD